MKNTLKPFLVLITVFCFMSVSMAQSSAERKRLEEQKYSKEDVINKESEKSINYIEIKVHKFGKENKIEVSKLNFKNAPENKQKGLYKQKESFDKMIELVQLGEANLIEELGKNGITIVSHNFAIIKEEVEIHYYIVIL